MIFYNVATGNTIESDDIERDIKMGDVITIGGASKFSWTKDEIEVLVCKVDGCECWAYIIDEGTGRCDYCGEHRKGITPHRMVRPGQHDFDGDVCPECIDAMRTFGWVDAREYNGGCADE